MLVKLVAKLRHHVMYHLPFFFPIALNVVIGTSYAFIFVLFFFLQITFAIFNDFKIHLACGVENKFIKCIAQNLGYVLTFFAWVNVWGASTSPMPFYIRRAWIIERKCDFRIVYFLFLFFYLLICLFFIRMTMLC